MKLVNTIIANTKGDGEKSGEDFWVKAEKLYYTALIGYIWYEAPEDEKNFTTLLEMINASEAREDDEDSRTRLTSCLNVWKKKTRNILQSSSTKIQTCGGQDRKKHTYLMRREVSPFDINGAAGAYGNRRNGA